MYKLIYLIIQDREHTKEQRIIKAYIGMILTSGQKNTCDSCSIVQNNRVGRSNFFFWKTILTLTNIISHIQIVLTQQYVQMLKSGFCIKFYCIANICKMPLKKS